MTKKLVNEKKTDSYEMSVFEVPTAWGIVKETIFTRPENKVGQFTLRTVIREWVSQKGHARSNKKYEILENDKVIAYEWANVRWDSEEKKEYLANKSEVRMFFQLWDLYKRFATK